jgi:hypothetical protein
MVHMLIVDCWYGIRSEWDLCERPIFQLMYSWHDDQPAANTSAVMLLTVPINTNSSHADIGISTRGMPVYWSDDNIWPGTSPAGCKYF